MDDYFSYEMLKEKISKNLQMTDEYLLETQKHVLNIASYDEIYGTVWRAKTSLNKAKELLEELYYFDRRNQDDSCR